MLITILYLWILFNGAFFLTLFISFYLNFDTRLRALMNTLVWAVFVFEGIRKSFMALGRPIF